MMRTKAKKLTFLLAVTLGVTACMEDDSLENSKNNNDTFYQKHFSATTSSKAFSQPLPMTYEEEKIFYVGRSFFRIPWVEAPSATTARDGLGPLFSANTCMNCHPKNGAGVALDKNAEMSRSLLLRLSDKDINGSNLVEKDGFVPHPTYGAQLSRNGNQKVPFEGVPKVKYKEIEGKYPDGNTYTLRKPSYTIEKLAYGALDKETVIAPRIGSALIGLGLLEQISEKDLLEYQDISDANGDGISGKANYAYSPELNKSILGRFTWKASATSVKHQSAAAAHNDMGLSNPLFPSHNCTSKQIECIEEAKKGEHKFDLPEGRLNSIVYYLTHLAVPLQREIGQHKEGEKLFKELNCVACHVSSYSILDGLEIKPYSDLLLHDMGDALKDGRSEFLANGSEWRTAPLWGIGLYQSVSGEANYLHDGRARSIEEAILWHGGEAQKSKEAFMSLTKKRREKILKFLNTI